jgi:hypothetical protein
MKVRAIFAELTGIKPALIHPETRFFDDRLLFDDLLMD